VETVTVAGDAVHILAISQLDYARLGLSSSKVSDGAHQGLLGPENHREPGLDGTFSGLSARSSGVETVTVAGDAVVPGDAFPAPLLPYHRISAPI
jgi:hypothetical protein